MNFSEKIKKVNDMLDEYGGDAIQEYDKSKSGGFSSVGFKSQYILDAMNEVFGSDGWRHILHSVETREVSNKDGGKRLVSVAEVSIQFLDKNVAYFETGKQFGGGNVVAGAVADAFKAAVTDAIGKALSLLSVGNKAYRGTLVKEYKGQVDKITETEDEIVVEMSANRFTPKNGTNKLTGFQKPATPVVSTPLVTKAVETKVEEKKEPVPPVVAKVPETPKPVAPVVPAVPNLTPPKSFLQGTPKTSFKETKSFKDYFKD